MTWPLCLTGPHDGRVTDQTQDKEAPAPGGPPEKPTEDKAWPPRHLEAKDVPVPARK